VPSTTADIQVRRARPEDRPAVVALAGAALGWGDDGPHAQLFAWKHLDNPAGPSPAWVAEMHGTLVGFRTFLQWPWLVPAAPMGGDDAADRAAADGTAADDSRVGGRRRGPSTAVGVRAVDTATHPDQQGRGIFRTLTLGALAELAGTGAAFVYNTPNRQSLPGYLRMGWRPLGRVAVAVRPRGATGAAAAATARTPATKWSEPCLFGTAAPAFFADREATARLLAARSPSGRIETDRTPAHLAWRYAFAPLHYRCLPTGDRVEDGALVFRVRRRGEALEATICENLTALGPRRLARLLDHLLERTGADYAIGTRHDLPGVSALPLPRQGPLLTWRDLGPARPPRRGDFALSLGDIELF
jgi:GNAT superfamily N-acetyltransferase